MIQSIHIKNFKNFKDTKIEGFTKLNIITGENNVGKSNLLEALYCLVGKDMHPCANITEIYDNIRKEPLTTDSANLIFYGLDTSKKIQITTTLDNQTLDLQIELVSNENQRVIESQITPTTEYAQAFSQLNFALKKNNKEIYKDNLNIAKIPNFPLIPNQPSYNRQFPNFNPNQLRELSSFQRATIITPSDVARKQNAMNPNTIQAVRKICDNNQQEESLNKSLSQFNKNIQSISFSANNQLKLKVRNIEKEKAPLSIFGDGFIKYLHIMSALIVNNAKVICVDEVENGLHFSTMRLLLEHVVDFLKKDGEEDEKHNNLQVFMTTHSQEFVEILDQVIKEKDFAYETKLFCLKNKNENSQDIVSQTYYGEALSTYFINEVNLFGGSDKYKEKP
ncbi:AAA family ATPase [Helicobacter cetorum]|uniref:ATPase AAA-type core domain-containing protein n=1 Tax=Helicobacter cetorum (strain ATCC BAA-429 / MIT 00-7128) TaxID=182217 RepID=I0ELX9_HELC0|nr:ATP/GTP-binding protein [Helicobacter cetorum]AFI03948.1 hypothetical protein HCW_03345 [Helicobacter cetorum MIT 00-7128]